jgi:outer membrane protein OmpA-like peptidoglycan-associated protein
MTDSILSSLTDLITPSLLSQAASVFGENPDAVGKGLSAAMPLLLGGIAEKASTPSFASTLFGMLQDPKIDTGLLNNAASLLAGNALSSGPSASLGGSLLSALFGSNQNMVAGALAKFAGVSPATASSLMKFGAPLALSVLNNKVRSGQLDLSSLVRMLTNQKSEITAALPAGLGNISNMLDRGTAAAAATATAAKDTGSSIWRWLLPLLLLLGALWLLMQFMGGDKDAEQPVQIERPAQVERPAAPELPAPTEQPAQISSSAPSANVYFESGSAIVPADASTALSEVVSYMLANPGSMASIAGYHDRTGSADLNEELAKDRAIKVQEALIAAGIDPSRLELNEPLISGAGMADEARRVEVIVR